MAADGSLHDVGFDEHCAEWIDGCVAEAVVLNMDDNLCIDYLVYAIERMDDSVMTGAVGCTFYADLK